MNDCFTAWWSFCQLPQHDGRADDTAGDGAGLTRWGWTYPTWRMAMRYADGANLNPSAFQAMPQAEAGLLARIWFWDRLRAAEMPSGVNISVIDWCWTSGGAVHEIQQLVGVVPDGIVGPCTLAALNGASAPGLIHDICIDRFNYYAVLNLLPRFPGLWQRALACKSLSLACLGE